jgi:MoaA/NifB/PqqE/SkfB family radical SAM enzyme
MAQDFLEDHGKKFCILPWIHMATYTNGKALLCCLAQPTDDERLNLNTATIDGVWNSYYFKNARRDMMAGKALPACMHCWKEEASGIRSHRMNENNLWTKKLGREYIDNLIASTQEDGFLEQDVITLDLRLGNTCNVQCVMCRPTDSSKWVKAAEHIVADVEDETVRGDWQWKINDHKNNSFEWAADDDFWIDEIEPLLPNMRHFIFAGGEPLYLKNHKRFLKKCVESGHAGNIELRYHTNGTIMPDDIIELWSNFKFVELMLSIDGMGEQNYWLRYPTDWATVEKTLDKVENAPPHIVGKVLCTVSALNIWYLPDFAEWLFAKDYKKIGIHDHQGMFHPGILHYPQYMCSKVLPENLKARVTEKLQAFIAKYPEKNKVQELQSVVNFMNSEDWSDKWTALIKYTQSIDRMRKTDFVQAFPELWKLIENEV